MSDQSTNEIKQYDPQGYPTARAFRIVNDAHTKLCIAGTELTYPKSQEKSDRIRELEDEAREAVMNLFHAMSEERGFTDEESKNVYLDAGSKVWSDEQGGSDE